MAIIEYICVYSYMFSSIYILYYIFFVLFVAVLVYTSLILKVSVNFLPVGHTHEDVDQFFSRIASQLRKTGAESVPGQLK